MSDSPAPPAAASTPADAVLARQTPAAVAAWDDDGPSALDDISYDPADYDWHPVARRKRTDGWTHTRQRKFIEILADTGSVREAARTVEMSMQSAYRLRRSPGAEAFATAWDAAIEEASKRLLDIAMERAVNGIAERVFDKDGACIAVRRKYNDRLLMFMLRAFDPAKFRYAHGDLRHPAEPAPVAAPPVAKAIDRLTPPTPPNPELLVDPEELETRLLCAHLADGELPRWLKDRGGDCDLTPEMVAPDIDAKLRRILAREAEGRDPVEDIERLERESHLL